MVTLGIDLGTSNSAAALLFGLKTEARMVRPPEGQSDGAIIFPSYIAFKENADLDTVGLRAKERFRDGATDLVVRHFKRLIGRSYDHAAAEISMRSRFFEEFKGRIERGPDGEVLIRVRERKYAVTQIASFLLRKIWDEAQTETQKRSGGEIEKVIISIPAGFDNEQREATLAAAKAAGLVNVDVIEEPTAAAVVRGVEGQRGKIIVIDVGAGTTDVVVAYVEQSEKGKLSLDMASRECDDVLGGMDMDYLVLDYLFQQDKNQPMLKDIYPTLDDAEKGRLMAAIETAKINVSLDGSAAIVITLRVGSKPKRISVPVEEKTLTKIVHPLVWGREVNGKPKGIKPVVEKALLRAAGNDPQKVGEVKRAIENIVLVGGPCRMKCIHNMLRDIFTENETVCKQIDAIDPLSSFAMEAVAKGAAESVQFEGGIWTEVPHDIAVFHWSKGITPVVPKGEPYTREEGVSLSANIPFDEGSNVFYIVTEKGPMSNWPMREHLVVLPQEGMLRVTLRWSETGLDDKKSNKLQGAGLLEAVEIPQTSNRTTLGAELKKAFRNYLEQGVLPIRQRVTDGRDWSRRRLFQEYAAHNAQLSKVPYETALDQFSSNGITLRSQIEKAVNQMLQISDEDLRRCEALQDVDTLSEPEEKDIDYALKNGYFRARNESWAPSRGVPKRATEILTFLPWGEDIGVPVQFLIRVAEELIGVGRQHAPSSPFVLQLVRWLDELKSNPTDPNKVYMVANCLDPLAAYLHDSNLIDHATFNLARNITYASGRKGIV